MRALLDVNVLIGLLDSSHIHHARARAWLEAEIDRGWASCPLTQNGCVRVLSQPNYPGGANPPAHVASRLRQAISTPWHESWFDDISLLDSDRFDWRHILGSRQLTDAYLLALAVHHNGRLVTFDRSLSLSAVKGADEWNLVTI